MHFLTIFRRLLVGISLFCVLTSGHAFGQEDATAIVGKILDNMRGESQIATLNMTVFRPDKETVYTMRIYSEGEERGHTRVIAPSRDAGQAFLNDGDNIFIYTPRLKRVLRLPPSGQSDSFLGSDIAYNDLSGDDIRDQYNAHVLEEDETSITLELIPNADASTPFGKLHLSAEKPSFAPTKVTFFDQRDSPVKENVFSNYAELEGRYIPQRLEVTDLLKEGHKTVVEWQDADFGVDIPDACFTQNALEREGVCE